MELENCNRPGKARLGVLVDIPPEHQGVADALRAAFVPAHNKLPPDLAELLTRLR